MKFLYRDKVKVVDGFYKGQIGRINDTRKWLFGKRKYYVRFEYAPDAWFGKHDLEKVNE